MPCFSRQTTPAGLRKLGPLVEVLIVPSSAYTKYLRDEGKGKEQKDNKIYKGTMLIDTGASTTAIDREVAEFLNLKHRGVTTISTPSSPAHECLTYDIDLMLPANNIRFANVQVIEGEFKTMQGISGLIGRDILSTTLLVYHGYSGHYTLAI